MAKKKSKLAFPLGMLIIIFSIIGIVATVKAGVTLFKDLTDNSAQKAEYEEFLRPVVMYDPDPFDDVRSADITQLVNAAIWSLITQSNSTEAFSYSTGDNMGILIPVEQVTDEFIRLFGGEIDIASQYNSIDMSSHDITYDSAQGGFIIPITSLEVAYTPEVYEIEKKANSIILSVGYIGSKAWAEIDGNEYVAPQPDKFMKITLRQGDRGYYIASLQSVNAQEVANAPTVAATVVPAISGNIADENIIVELTEPSTAGEGENGEDETGEGETNEEDESATSQADENR
ncbi:MAG: hypothetical protein IJK60_07155 [Clostridia bacterium]|nr:hypothetical protein [Clostridia bacterium]